MTRGQKVLWWSPLDSRNISKAIFVKIDPLSPRDAILAIKIGTYKHSFRWPLRLTKPEMTQRHK